MFKNFFRTLFFLLVVLQLISSCVVKPLTDIKPDWTSYPVDKVVQETASMWIAPKFSSESNIEVLQKSNGKSLYSSSSKSNDSVTYDFERTLTGDRAIHEMYILPKSRYRSSEKYLFKQVPEKGHEICGEKYAIYDSKYYYGTEATLQMDGITSPALMVEYRCPVYFSGIEARPDIQIREIAKKYPNHIYFDTIIKTFNVNVGKVNDAVLKVIKQEGIQVESDGLGNINHIFGIKDKPGGNQQRVLEIVMTLEAEGNNSVLKFIYMPYTTHVHKRGVLHTEKPSTFMGVTPSNRKYSYRKSLLFLSKIDKYLQSGGID